MTRLMNRVARRTSLRTRMALLSGLASVFVAVLLSLGLYHVTRRWANISIEMTTARALLVLVLSVSMCGVSGLASLAKVHRADPADLF